MKTTLLSLATALALGALAGCDRNPEPRAGQASPASSAPSSTSSASSGSTSAPATPQSNTPTTPANVQGGKEASSNPVQQQVDPKQPEQQRDFKMQGDAAGPKNPDGPKPGG